MIRKATTICKIRNKFLYNKVMTWFNVSFLSPRGISERHLTYVEEHDYAPWVLYEAIEEQTIDELGLKLLPSEQCVITRESEPSRTIQSYRFWENPNNAEKAIQMMEEDGRGPMHCHDWIEVLATSPYASQWIRDRKSVV